MTSASQGSRQLPAPKSAQPDSLGAEDLIQPEELAHLMAGPAPHRPVLVHVGFKVLYRGGHIAGSRYVGPASKPEGLAALKQFLQPLPRQTALVLYCGCCPWEVCPNVRPALRTTRAMGFKRVKVLFLAKSLRRDWIDRGLPITDRDP